MREHPNGALLSREFDDAELADPSVAGRLARRTAAIVRREREKTGARTFAAGDDIPDDVARVHDLDGSEWARQGQPPDSLKDTRNMTGSDPGDREESAHGTRITPGSSSSTGRSPRSSGGSREAAAMPDLPAIADNAANLPSALAGSGGILRCGKYCRAQMLSESGITGNLRHDWPEYCGQAMRASTRTLLPAGQMEVPHGHELIPAESEGCRLQPGKRCRPHAGRFHRACSAQSAAALNRGTLTDPGRYASCLDHLHASWNEDGKVMHWILRETRRNDRRD